VKSYNFLFWAYNIIWVGLTLYVALTFARLRKVESRLDGLERELNRDSPADDA
jgi:CcmD family protein